MRIRYLAAALIAALSVPAALFGQDPSSAPPAIKLTYTAPKKGTVVTAMQTQSMTLEAKATLNGQVIQEVNQQRDGAREIKATVAEADDKALQTVKVEVVRNVANETTNGMEAEREEPSHGKSYTVNAGDPPKVAYVDGGEPGADEVSLGRRIFGDLSKGDRLVRYLADKQLKLGTALDIPAAEAEKILSSNDDGDEADSPIKAQKMTVTPSSVENGVLTLDMKVTAGGTDPNGLTTTIEMSGNATIELATGRILSQQFAGPLTLAGEMPTPNGNVVVAGTGKMTVGIKFKYE